MYWGWGRAGTRERREVMGKVCRRVNTVQNMCAHVCKWKNKTCQKYSRNGGRGDKEDQWRG
jgi:hypothetical protein